MPFYSVTDKIIFKIQKGLDKLFPVCESTRLSPAREILEPSLSSRDRQLSEGLMRINHTGEICAQGLYYGQALASSNNELKEKFKQAAREERDHLAWCSERLQQLSGRASYLNFFWYLCSLSIGYIAGRGGDKISLGFLAETEYQVEQHLGRHLEKLPLVDYKSRIILERMREEELAHAVLAEAQGGKKFPLIIKKAMRLSSKLMTTIAYKI